MKKTFRRVLALVSAISILLSAAVVSYATQPPAVEPRLTGISSLSAGLSISSTGLATCVGRVHNNGDYDVTMTIALQQDGETIKSWTVDTVKGLNNIPKYHYVMSGHDYQVVVTAIIKSGSIIVNAHGASSTVVSY